MGNRIAKVVREIDVNSAELSENTWELTLYARDAQGNPMATYTGTYQSNGDVATMKQSEKNIYGSSRVGMEKADQLVYHYLPIAPGSNNMVYTNNVGDKAYELSNHPSMLLRTSLGNVLAVVSDYKQVITDASHQVSSYEADIVSVNDYYPFGMLSASFVFDRKQLDKLTLSHAVGIMPGRHANSSEYRYGFNGMEKDDEVAGEGNSYTAEFWQYDPRAARRWNVDPVIAESESSYAAFRNTPILLNDPNGDCPDCPDLSDRRVLFEGEFHKSSNGNEYRLSTKGEQGWFWVPGSLWNEYTEFKSTFVASLDYSYFDYYAGEKGFDPNRSDWDMGSSFGMYHIDKLNKTLAVQSIYNNDAADNLIWHYAYGDGENYNMSLDEFKSGVGTRLLKTNRGFGLNDFPEGRKAINKAKNANLYDILGNRLNVSVPVEFTIPAGTVYANHPGTIGNHSIKISGVIEVIAKGIWIFKGTMNIVDRYDFNVGKRPVGDELKTQKARRQLYGMPFDIIMSYQISQGQFDRQFSIFNGMNFESSTNE